MYVTHFLRQHYLLQVNGYNLSLIRNPADSEGHPRVFIEAKVEIV